jgi:hypothetical protein
MASANAVSFCIPCDDLGRCGNALPTALTLGALRWCDVLLHGEVSGPNIASLYLRARNASLGEMTARSLHPRFLAPPVQSWPITAKACALGHSLDALRQIA